MNRRVLLVDDEERVLEGYRRVLRKHFEITTALSGKEGLEAAEGNGGYAVIVSDYRMPEMNGVQLLSKVRELYPDTVRIMLTGQADLAAIVAAINESDVFRFLSKPCPADALAAVLNSGIEQHRLVSAEKELLEETLRQTVDVLFEVLGLVDPATHMLSAGLRDRVADICGAMALDHAWEFELAAMMSQLGTIALPPETVAKHRGGKKLSETDSVMMDQHPQSAYNLLVKIPRLERVARMVLNQARPPGSKPLHQDAPDDEDIEAMGAHLVNIALTFEGLLQNALTPAAAIERLRGQGGTPFRMRAIDTLEAASRETARYVHLTVGLDELEAGMELDADVKTPGGLLLLATDQLLTEAHLQRLRRFPPAPVSSSRSRSG
ncbi:MAG: response regulator [Acidimicrobiia bacterium]